MEDNWSEVDTSKKEENKVEFEVEKEPEKVEAKPEPVQEKKEEPKKEEPQELDGIQTKGAEKRIRQLIRQRKERDEQIAQLIQQNEKLKSSYSTKEDDYICYGKHAGQKLFYKGIKLLLLFDDQIIMKVEDPTHLDPTFNLTKI